MAVVWGIEIFGPLIEQHSEGGEIVSAASIAGLLSRSSRQYNVTEYGVVALSEGMRVALAPRDIGVSVRLLSAPCRPSARRLDPRLNPLRQERDQIRRHHIDRRPLRHARRHRQRHHYAATHPVIAPNHLMRRQIWH